MTFIPTPLEDEWLYSVVGRWFALSGFASESKFCVAAFGSPLDTSSLNAGYFVNLTWQGGSTIDRTSIPERLSLLPAARPFINEVLYAKYFALPPDSSERWSTWHPKTESLTRPPQYRYCQVCATEQRAEFGFAVWLRAHQLPGVGACVKHSVELKNVRARPNHLDMVPTEDITAVSATDEEIWFAFEAKSLLDLALPNVASSQHRQAWKDAISREFGHTPTSSGLNLEPIFAKRFTPSFLERILGKTRFLRVGNLARALVKKDTGCIDPVHSILLAKVLGFDTISTFLIEASKIPLPKTIVKTPTVSEKLTARDTRSQSRNAKVYEREQKYLLKRK